MAKYLGADDDDFYRGTAANDTIYGFAGYDSLYGEGGTDRIWGGADDDDLHGGDARDYLYGEDGYDTLYGEAGNDIIYGGAGEDWAFGGIGNDYLSGDAEADVLRGELGNDQLIGGDGDDSLRGGAGIDRVDGGAGNDSVSFFDPGAKQGAVVDLRTQTVTNDGFGNAETLISVESISGTVFADTMLGTDTANTFSGGKGDTIRGFGGTDLFYISSVEGATLDGGTGVNSLNLTGRIDTYGPDGKIVSAYADQDMVVDLAKQQVVNDGFGCSAKIIGFRNATTGNGDDTMIGSSAPNTLVSGYGADHLSGGAGNDVLSGGMGGDTLTGGAGNDTFGFGIFGEYLGVPLDFGDTITDFTAGDKLDIRPSLTPLIFVGTGEFGNRIRAIRYYVDGGDTYVEVRDHEPSGWFDMTIKLLGVHHLTTADFVHLQTGSAPFGSEQAGYALHSSSHLGDLASLA